jgi:hypothetical protein
MAAEGPTGVGTSAIHPIKVEAAAERGARGQSHRGYETLTRRRSRGGSESPGRSWWLRGREASGPRRSCRGCAAGRGPKVRGLGGMWRRTLRLRLGRCDLGTRLELGHRRAARLLRLHRQAASPFTRRSCGTGPWSSTTAWAPLSQRMCQALRNSSSSPLQANAHCPATRIIAQNMMHTSLLATPTAQGSGWTRLPTDGAAEKFPAH